MTGGGANVAGEGVWSAVGCRMNLRGVSRDIPSGRIEDSVVER